MHMKVAKIGGGGELIFRCENQLKIKKVQVQKLVVKNWYHYLPLLIWRDKKVRQQ